MTASPSKTTLATAIAQAQKYLQAAKQALDNPTLLVSSLSTTSTDSSSGTSTTSVASSTMSAPEQPRMFRRVKKAASKALRSPGRGLSPEGALPRPQPARSVRTRKSGDAKNLQVPRTPDEAEEQAGPCKFYIFENNKHSRKKF